MDFLEVIAELGLLAVELDHAAHESLHKIGEIVQEEAKEEIGVYQGAAGPTEAWATLAESTQADREARGFSADEPLLRTGDLRDSISYIVDGNEVSIGSDSDVAVYQELGTATIPPRSFLVGAAYRKEDEIVEAVGHEVDVVIK